MNWIGLHTFLNRDMAHTVISDFILFSTCMQLRYVFANRLWLTYTFFYIFFSTKYRLCRLHINISTFIVRYCCATYWRNICECDSSCIAVQCTSTIVPIFFSGHLFWCRSITWISIEFSARGYSTIHMEFHGKSMAHNRMDFTWNHPMECAAFSRLNSIGLKSWCPARLQYYRIL